MSAHLAPLVGEFHGEAARKSPTRAPERFQHRWGGEGHRFYRELMWPFVVSALATPDAR